MKKGANISISTQARRRATKRMPSRHEKYVAESLGGKLSPASGALAHMKGDVFDVDAGEFEFLVECKSTSRASLSIKREWLRKVRMESRSRLGRDAALAIRFEEGGKTEDWVAVPMETFVRMLEVAREMWEQVTEGK